MRAALITESGDVENVVIVPDGEPDLVPVFEDGEQVWDETDDGERVPRMQAAPPWTPPEGLTAVPLDDDSRVGIGWRYVDGEWVEPAAEPAPEETESEDQRLGAALRAILTPEQIAHILG